jgi:hypothetical protein
LSLPGLDPDPCDLEQFIEFYYNTFDTDRKTLGNLYVSYANTTGPNGRADNNVTA